jgi:hypothetical protein
MFYSFVSFRKIDWHASGFITCVEPASFGLLCVWREVLILRQRLQILKKQIENTTVAGEGKSRGQERAPLVVVADRTHYYSARLDQGQRRRPAGGARPISSPTLTAGEGKG